MPCWIIAMFPWRRLRCFQLSSACLRVTLWHRFVTQTWLIIGGVIAHSIEHSLIRNNAFGNTRSLRISRAMRPSYEIFSESSRETVPVRP